MDHATTTDVSRAPSTASLSDARDHLSEIVEEVVATGGELVITKHGRPAAVILAIDEYESLVETLNLLSDRDVMDALDEADRDIESGELFELD